MQLYAILAYRNYRYWSKCKTQDVLTCWLMSNKSEIRTELLAWRCDAFCNCLHCCRLVPLASQVLVPLEQAGHVRTIRSIRTSKISKSYLNCFELIFELRIYLIWTAIAWYAKWRAGDGSAWLRHAFGLATMSWAFCLAACKNSPSVWIFTLQFDASELWKGFWFAHGFVTKRYKGI